LCCISKHHETKPLHSFIQKVFYSCHFCSVDLQCESYGFFTLKDWIKLSFVLEKTQLSHGMSKCHETKPLHSFVNKTFSYIYQQIRGARTLFYNVPTYGKKYIEFLILYELKIRKLIFIFILLYCGNKQTSIP